MADFSVDNLETDGGLLLPEQGGSMPLKKCSTGDASGWKWGANGSCFVGDDARQRALAVGRALHAQEVDAAKTQEREMVSQAQFEAQAMKIEDLEGVLACLPFHPDELRTQWIKKADEEKRIVWGEVYVPDIPDTQHEFMTAVEIEKMAHGFLMSGRTNQIDVQHDNDCRPGCAIVESFIARKSDPEFITGAWVIAMKIDHDELWEKVKSGELNGFSMQARVVVSEKVVEVDLPPEVSGLTQVGQDGSLHRHGYTVRFDSDGGFRGGRTTVVEDHWHQIGRRSVTETSVDPRGNPIPGGHFHRYTLLDKLAGKPIEESPGYGEPEEGFVEIAKEGEL